MQVQILKSKIQEVQVSESNKSYPGSISLPDELLKASGIKQFELVHVNNKTNGNRIVTQFFYSLIFRNYDCPDEEN